MRHFYEHFKLSFETKKWHRWIALGPGYLDIHMYRWGLHIGINDLKNPWRGVYERWDSVLISFGIPKGGRKEGCYTYRHNWEFGRTRKPRVVET